MEARVPATVSTSLVLHVAGALLWLRLNKAGPQAATRVIGDVDLMIKVRTPAAPLPLRPAAKPPPLSTWNFLKLALPSIPKAAGPLEMKPVEAGRKALLDMPQKLEDKGRLRKLAKIEPLDLGRKRVAAAQLDVGAVQSETRRAAFARLPKLDEVGTRRASPKAIAMAEALEQEQSGRLLPQGLGATAEPPKGRHSAPQAAPLLPEAASPPPKKTVLGRMADMLTSEAPPLPMQVERRPVERARPRLDVLGPGLPRNREGPLAGPKKKAMEIEGPLASRKLVYYELPPFPRWLAEEGATEAEVRIRFFVNPDGSVVPEMQVETTSGFGRLDRLAMASLTRWKFEPIEGSGRRWGIITFRFIAE